MAGAVSRPAGLQLAGPKRKVDPPAILEGGGQTPPSKQQSRMVKEQVSAA
jgi:hypothetical protein